MLGRTGDSSGGVGSEGGRLRRLVRHLYMRSYRRILIDATTRAIWAGGSLSQLFGLRRQSEAATALFSRRCGPRAQMREVIAILAKLSLAKRCGAALPTALQNAA